MIYFFGFILSLLAFFAVCMTGLITGQPVLQVLIRASIAAIISLFLGVIVGAVTGKLLRQVMENKHKDGEEKPVQPSSPEPEKRKQK